MGFEGRAIGELRRRRVLSQLRKGELNQLEGHVFWFYLRVLWGCIGVFEALVWILCEGLFLALGFDESVVGLYRAF